MGLKQMPDRKFNIVDGGFGGGQNGNMLEARIAKVEAHLEDANRRLDRIDVDIRWLLAAFGAGFVFLAGLIAKGFHWL